MIWAGGNVSDDEEGEVGSAGSWRSKEGRAGARYSRSSSTCSLDSLALPWKMESEVVATSFGPVNVNIWGSTENPPLITYHDVGLNHVTCFQGLFMCSDMSALLFKNFCIYHIDAPGHEVEAPEVSLFDAELTAEELMEQVAEVVFHYKLKQALCMGVTAGAYILTLLAARYPSLVGGLILISPICKSPSWSEWACAKMITNTLYFYGYTRSIKEALLERYFCKDLNGYQGPAPDTIRSFRKELEERIPSNVSRYIQAMASRKDLTCELQRLCCRTLIVVGDHSPFRDESEHMMAHMNPETTSLFEVEACGSLVTEERPHMLEMPLERFLLTLGYDLSATETISISCSPVHSPTSILYSMEEFSPKGCGLKLKPIRTRLEL